MNINLKGKNALVGGGSKGIGKAVAISLARQGANVTLLARDAIKLSEACQQLDHSQGQHHDFMSVDFKNVNDLRKKVHTLVLTKPIDILINNTGGPAAGALGDASPVEFLEAFNNHLVCNQVLSQLVLKGMKRRGYGRLINIISTSVKQPIDGLGVSNTIRGAVANWSKTLANEVAEYGVTVNNVLPGYTATERLAQLITYRAEKGNITEEEVQEEMEAEVPVKRFAEPKEIGDVVAFLASPAAAYINGVNLPVDGGKTKSL